MPAPIRRTRAEILAALTTCHGQRAASARMLHVSPATLRRWLDNDPSLLDEVASRQDRSLMQEANLFRRGEPRLGLGGYRFRRRVDFFKFPIQRRMTDVEVAFFEHEMEEFTLVV